VLINKNPVPAITKVFPMSHNHCSKSARTTTASVVRGLTATAIVAVAVSSCATSASEQSSVGGEVANQYVTAANDVGVRLAAVSRSDSSPEDLQLALATALPVIKNDIAQMKAAQQQLPSELQNIAKRCTALANDVESSMNAADSAIDNRDQSALTTSLTDAQTEIDELRACGEEFNMANTGDRN